MSTYRLVEHFRTGGPITFPTIYPTVDAATDAAERILDDLAMIRPSRQPCELVVVDPATGEIVTRVRPYLDTDYDPDPFPASGVPAEPDADPPPPGRGGGHAGTAAPPTPAGEAPPAGDP